MLKKKTVVVNSYDWTITFWKFIKQFALVGVIAALTWAITDGLAEVALEYPQYALLISLITAVLIALANYLKHYKDTEEVLI